jgi:hypothetical protein
MRLRPHPYEFAPYYDQSSGLTGRVRPFIQSRQLPRVSHHVDAGDPPVLHGEAHRSAQLAVELNPTPRRALEHTVVVSNVAAARFARASNFATTVSSIIATGPSRSSRRADSSSVTVGGVFVMASAYSSTSSYSGVNTSDSRQRGTWLALVMSRFWFCAWK